MMHITKELAHKMEDCIKQSHIEVTKQYSKGKILDLSTGVACFSTVDSFLSQVVAWGFALKPSQFELEIVRIEQFYRDLKHQRVDIELCPYVGNALAVFLSERGYQVTELNNVSVLDLTEYKPIDWFADDYTIRTLAANEFKDWAAQIAIGFDYMPAREQFLHYAQAKNIQVFGAFAQNRLVAGASIAMHGKVCDLGVTSTLPLYRNKGLQKKLLFARLNEAKNRGLEIATVTTEPGTISDLNIQKVGFSCAYTRIKFTKIDRVC